MGCGSSSSTKTVETTSDVIGRQPTPNVTRTQSGLSASKQVNTKTEVPWKGSGSLSAKSLKSSRAGNAVTDDIISLSSNGSKKSLKEHDEQLQSEYREHIGLIMETLNEEITYYKNEEKPEEDLGWLPAWAQNGGNWKPASWRKEYTDRCRERIKTTEYFNKRGRLRTKNIQPGDDPNKCVFPLCPDWLNPEDLRWYYTPDYVTFDTDLEGVAWPSHKDDFVRVCDPDETHGCFTQQLRPWLDEWEVFDVDIDGEAGWDVIQLDLFKNDVLTEDQQTVLEARVQRTDFEDKDRMTRRREAMAKHFIMRYEKKDDTILKAVQSWADTIVAGEQKFFQLCEN